MGIICTLLTVHTGRTFQSSSKHQRLLDKTRSEEELVGEPINSRQKQQQQLLFEDVFFMFSSVLLVQVKSFIGAQPLCTGGIKTCWYEDLFTGISSIKVLCPPCWIFVRLLQMAEQEMAAHRCLSCGLYPEIRWNLGAAPLQRTIFSGQFTVKILLLLTRLQRGGAGLPATALPPPPLPRPGMKLTSACGLGAEISPNRCDKNPIPRAAMGRAPRESDLGAVTSDGFLSPPPSLRSRQRHADGLNACPPSCLCAACVAH